MGRQMSLHREMVQRRTDQLTLFEGSGAPAPPPPWPAPAAARSATPPPLYPLLDNFLGGDLLDDADVDAALFDFLED
jgi:hypothetical protein